MKIFSRLLQKRVLFFVKNKMEVSWQPSWICRRKKRCGHLGFVVEYVYNGGHLGFVVIFLRPKGVKGGFAGGLLEDVRERS